jgi:hypothetical protein
MHLPGLPRVSPLVYPATALSAASLAWTTWSLVDLLGTGAIGYTVAAGADVVWASVIAAEARGLHIDIKGRNLVPGIGWTALLAVAGLLVWHGLLDGSIPMAAAGPLLPLGAKVVWLLALVDGSDPAALTSEQEAEIHSVIRDSEHAARLHDARRDRAERDAQAAIERIRQQARITVARDRADFEITLERLEMRAEIERCSPMMLAPITAPDQPAITPSKTEHPHASGRPDPAPTSASIADLAREHVANTPDNAVATKAICALRPNENKDSVAAAVRRARRTLDGRTGGYG